MGWKGALRSINAEANRQARNNAKLQRYRQKQQEQENAHNAVARQEYVLQTLVSLHHSCNADLNWDRIRIEPSPVEPQAVTSRADIIQKKIENLKPGLLDKIPHLSGWRKKRLNNKLPLCKEEDQKEFERLFNNYQEDKGAWNKRQALAERLQLGDGKVYMDIIKEYGQLAGIPLGKDLKFMVNDKNELAFDLKVSPQEEIIPDEEYSLRQSGTLSAKKMAKTKSIDIYQDHVCSCLLRVAREIFGLLPITGVQANALINALNSQTGFMEDQVIISALIKRETLAQLNLNNIDPSDSFKNFVHHMKFTKSKGFEAVERINAL